MYRYIQIGSDTAFRSHLPVGQIDSVLKACPACTRDKLHAFQNREGEPWFRINVGTCDASGNYPAGLPQDGDMANMIELICAAPGNVSHDQYFTALAQSIAAQLGWCIIQGDE